jgi:protein associated with RNAse G/E
MGDEVRVVYRKYDGSLHWHMTMRRLGTDEHGVWLGVPAQSQTRRGSEPTIQVAHAYVLLVPDGSWWTAAFNAEPSWTEIYCDITTPPVWPAADEVTMVDLDLDVIRRHGHDTSELLDEDEFAEHQVRYAYPPDVIEQARGSAEWLRGAVVAGEPFRSVYQQWLTHVTTDINQNDDTHY